jgi:hypothetical protein
MARLPGANIVVGRVFGVATSVDSGSFQYSRHLGRSRLVQWVDAGWHPLETELNAPKTPRREDGLRTQVVI